MNAKIHHSILERFGHWLGRTWRAGARIERRTSAWLVRQGVPKRLAVALLWAAKLACLGVLLYAAFWVALLLVLLVGAARVAGDSASREEDEWAFPTTDEVSRTPGYDPVFHNDATHVDYVEDDHRA